MFQVGVTDLNTAKHVAKRLYLQYCNGSSMERNAMELMLVDTYKIMVTEFISRTKIINQLHKISIFIIIYWILMVMAGSASMIFNPWPSNT